MLSAKHTISGDIEEIGEIHLPEHFGIYRIQRKRFYPAAYDADEYGGGSCHEEAAIKVFLRCEVEAIAKTHAIGLWAVIIEISTYSKWNSDGVLRLVTSNAFSAQKKRLHLQL